MVYFNYHAKIKRLLSENKFLRCEIVESYNDISPAMLIYFDGEKNPYPVRTHMWKEYVHLIGLDRIENIEDYFHYLMD